MNYHERLKEIEECVSTRSCDWEWLIARVKKLTEALEKYHIHGTDGCPNCETGRITLYAANGWCIECNPKAYERKASDEE